MQNSLYGPVVRRRRPSYGLDTFGDGFFGALSPRNFMDLLNRSNDINTTVGNDGITYDVNLAGFDQDEITLKVDPKTNMLNIDASHETETSSMQKNYAIYLGEDKIKAENLQTSYRNGLLSITVTKPEFAEEDDTFDVPINSAPGVNNGSITAKNAANQDESDATGGLNATGTQTA